METELHPCDSPVKRARCPSGPGSPADRTPVRRILSMSTQLAHNWTAMAQAFEDAGAFTPPSWLEGAGFDGLAERWADLAIPSIDTSSWFAGTELAHHHRWQAFDDQVNALFSPPSSMAEAAYKIATDVVDLTFGRDMWEHMPAAAGLQGFDLDRFMPAAAGLQAAFAEAVTVDWSQIVGVGGIGHIAQTVATNPATVATAGTPVDLLSDLMPLLILAAIIVGFLCMWGYQASPEHVQEIISSALDSAFNALDVADLFGVPIGIKIGRSTAP